MKQRGFSDSLSSRAVLAIPSALFLALSGAPAFAQISSGERPAYRSPIHLAYSPDNGSHLAVADRTWPGVVIIDSASGAVDKEVKLQGDPFNVVWNGADKVLVAEGTAGTVAEVNVTDGTVSRRIDVGAVAKGLAVTSDGRMLVCDRASNKLLIVKLDTGEVESTVAVGREPGTIALTPDGKFAIVGNKLPRPTSPLTGTPVSEVSIVNLATKEVRTVTLAKGTTMVRTIVTSPDSKWAYVTHQSPRGGLVVDKLDMGWVMTNALSIIDVTAGTLYSNFIFDQSGKGGANPWGVTINNDGSKLFVTLAGVREVATVDLTKLHKRLAGYTPEERIGLLTDLSRLHSDGTIKRTALPTVEGTRGITLSPDGKTLAVAAYFSGKVLFLSPDDITVTKTIPLPNNPAEDQIRSGERFYHSALNCQQFWLSCSSCHDEGRMDTLNWDLLNDGQGNPKQTKSHVFSSETPPTNVTGCRDNALVSARAGYMFIEFQLADEDRVMATYLFMKSIAPEPSPFLGPDGQLTPDAVEGKKIFEDPQVGCSQCHSGQYFTDMKKHDVGTRRFGTEGPDNGEWDKNGYDVPTLIEVWRTAPYLHLGVALTVKDVITKENKELTTHGNVKGLSDKQIDQLTAYIMQIGPTGRSRKTSAPPPDAGTPSDAASGTEGDSSSSSTPSDKDAGIANADVASADRKGTPDAKTITDPRTIDARPPQSSCACSLGARNAARFRSPFLALALLALIAARGTRRRPR